MIEYWFKGLDCIFNFLQSINDILYSAPVAGSMHLKEHFVAQSAKMGVREGGGYVGTSPMKILKFLLCRSHLLHFSQMSEVVFIEI